MKPGGSTPKNRSMNRSVTSSYFAPPMPWRNRSPRARRAQAWSPAAASEFYAASLQFQQSGHRSCGVASASAASGIPTSGDRRARYRADPAGRRDAAVADRRMSRPTTAFPTNGRPPSNRAGMCALPSDGGDGPVNRLVVHLPKTPHLRQQMGHQPLERFARRPGFAEPPGSQSPGAFQLVPRLGETRPEVGVSSRALGPSASILDKRIRHQRSHVLGHAGPNAANNSRSSMARSS